jgi:hypothetical protein
MAAGFSSRHVAGVPHAHDVADRADHRQGIEAADDHDVGFDRTGERAERLDTRRGEAPVGAELLLELRQLRQGSAARPAGHGIFVERVHELKVQSFERAVRRPAVRGQADVAAERREFLHQMEQRDVVAPGARPIERRFVAKHPQWCHRRSGYQGSGADKMWTDFVRLV